MQGTNGLSALFIWITILSFVLTGLWLLYRAWLARQTLVFLHQLVRRAETHGLAAQRHDLRKLAQTQPAGRWRLTTPGWNLKTGTSFTRRKTPRNFSMPITYPAGSRAIAC